MWSKREEVDYALQRRNSLQLLRRPQRSLEALSLCDADPLLIRSAKHHGEESPVPCPVCQARPVLNLNYVFGDQLGQYSGRIKSTSELEGMQSEYGEFKVRVVEVCVQCGWNHLISSYLLGDGVSRRPPRRQQTVEDIYG
ncbi:MAG TPA: DUF5318 family protein [Propionicimonas sp.]|nr:DUF5318 family protein [Propionicimonas sp.]